MTSEPSEIDPVRIEPLGDDDLADPEINQLWRAVEAEQRAAPGRTPRGAEVVDLEGVVRGAAHGVHVRAWVARERPERGARLEVCGLATLTLRDAAELAGVGKFELRVAGARRRRGVGTRMLRTLGDWAYGNGITQLYSWATASSAGAGFLSAMLEERYDEEVHAFLDLERMDSAEVERRAGAVPDPRLSPRVWVGRCPEGWLEAYARAHRGIGASVRGSEADGARVDADLVRRLESAAEGSGASWLTAAGVDEAGEIVGFSQITLYAGSTPDSSDGGSPGPSDGPGDGSGHGETVHQEYTGVVPSWRERGVAGWLKALALHSVRRRYPAARYLVTENNGRNAPIRNANARLGFEPYRHLYAWRTTLPARRLP